MGKKDTIVVTNPLGEFEFSAIMSDVGTEVTPNPPTTGTEDNLSSIGIDETTYKVDSGTEVIANPTLAGTEDELTGLQVGETKYKVNPEKTRWSIQTNDDGQGTGVQTYTIILEGD